MGLSTVDVGCESLSPSLSRLTVMINNKKIFLHLGRKNMVKRSLSVMNLSIRDKEERTEASQPTRSQGCRNLSWGVKEGRNLGCLLHQLPV